MSASSWLRRRLPSRAPLALLLLLVAAVDVPALAAAPPARNVPETFFGTRVDDPYRWLEDVKAPEPAAWMKAQAEEANRTLRNIQGRDAILAQLTRLDASVSERVDDVVRTPDGAWFYTQRGVADNQYKLVRRAATDAAPQVLVDPNPNPKAAPNDGAKGAPAQAINYFRPSPSGRLVAYGVSSGGSEAALLHVLDARNGKALAGPVDRADFGVSDWRDERTLYFTRLQAPRPGMPETAKYQNSEVVQLDVPSGQLQTVVRRDTPGITMTPDMSPWLQLSPDRKRAVLTLYNGVQREIAVYVTATSRLQQRNPGWQRVVDFADGVVQTGLQGDTLYLLSHRGAPRLQLLALDLKQPAQPPRVVVAQSDRVLSGIAPAADALYVEARVGNSKRLYRQGYGAKAALVEVALPVQGTFQLRGFENGPDAYDPRLPGVVIGLEGWQRARQIYRVESERKVVNTGLQPLGPNDVRDDIESHEVQVPSHDGALVPMTILARKGSHRDGRNPVLLSGYAAYGITAEPQFSQGRLAWIDAGGVLAVVNPRGSGVFGSDWYEAGKRATKPNSWRDFIACAEYLIAQRWTAPDRLGIQGGSAGGILVGRAMTERPDLFAAVVAMVGSMDMVRAELSANGPGNIPEFGSRSTEAGFRALLAMSTYHQIKDGVKYPAVLLTHGVNDPRVEVWHSTKTAARLMAASSSGKPVLLRLDYDAGHGVGSTKQQQLEQRADIYAFLLWQMGMPGYERR
jgi:prolyl oligopeptidase